MRGRWIALAACLPLVACATAPRDGGFSEVQRTVEARTAQRLEWSGDQPIAAPSAAADLAALGSGALTADAAVEIALRNNRELQATLEELGIARADLLTAGTIRNPLLDAELRFPATPKNPFEIALMEPLFDLLHLRARRAAGEAAFAVTRLRVTGAVLAFAGRVREHYYRAQAAQQIVERQGAILEAAGAAAELALRQHDAGNVSDLELESEQALYEQAKLESARVALDASQAREQLIADLGLVDPKTELAIPAQLPAIPAVEESAPPAGASERIDLALARAELDAARHSLSLSGSAIFEDLSVGVHRDREADGTSSTGPGLTLPIPIFDTGRARKAKARALLRQAEQRLYALDLAGQSAVRAATERAREAQSRALYLRDVVAPRRQRILALVGLEHSAMLVGPFDLLRARQELDRAGRDQILAERDYWIARSELEAATNGVLGFSEPQRVKERE